MCLMYNYLHTFYLLSLSGHLLYIIMYIPYMYMFVLQVVDDPSGNSFVENPMAPQPDPCMSVQYYDRDTQQDAALGIVPATVRSREGGESGWVLCSEYMDLPSCVQCFILIMYTLSCVHCICIHVQMYF